MLWHEDEEEGEEQGGPREGGRCFGRSYLKFWMRSELSRLKEKPLSPENKPYDTDSNCSSQRSSAINSATNAFRKWLLDLCCLAFDREPSSQTVFRNVCSLLLGCGKTT